jgi:AhpD family alkylhydroperoxidase
MRLPYVETPFKPANDEEQVIFDSIVARRGGAENLAAIDNTYLHTPLLAAGSNAFAKAVRTQNSLAPAIRELAFIRVAALTQCWYEWDIHRPIAIAAGMSEEVTAIIKKGINVGTPLKAGILSPQQLAVVEFADAMTLGIRVPEDVWNAVKPHFSQKELVELTASIAFFNNVCRFVTTLDVGEKG